MLPALRTVPAGVSALSRTKACPLSPLLFFVPKFSHVAQLQKKHRLGKNIQQTSSSNTGNTHYYLIQSRLWSYGKNDSSHLEIHHEGDDGLADDDFTCRLTSRVGCFVMSESNFSMAHNYSLHRLPVYLASDGWARFWSDRPLNLKVIELCYIKSAYYPIFYKTALFPSEHILLELGRGGGQCKMTSLVVRAERNPSNCLKWDDSWQWMWPSIGANEDAYYYWELAGLYFWDPKLPRAIWTSSGRLRCPGASKFTVLTEEVVLVVNEKRKTHENITQLSTGCSSIVGWEPQGDQITFPLAFSLQANTDCRES